MKFGRYRDDEDGHMYVIPVEKIEEFDNLFKKTMDDPEAFDLVNEFESKFGDYRVEGKFYDMDIVMEE